MDVAAGERDRMSFVDDMGWDGCEKDLGAEVTLFLALKEAEVGDRHSNEVAASESRVMHENGSDHSEPLRGAARSYTELELDLDHPRVDNME